MRLPRVVRAVKLEPCDGDAVAEHYCFILAGEPLGRRTEFAIVAVFPGDAVIDFHGRSRKRCPSFASFAHLPGLRLSRDGVAM